MRGKRDIDDLNLLPLLVTTRRRAGVACAEGCGAASLLVAVKDRADVIFAKGRQGVVDGVPGSLPGTASSRAIMLFAEGHLDILFY